jgi:predicted nucleotidyltransferase
VTKPNFLSILRTLRGEQVDFIVVGGVSGVLQGAPLTTFDLDVVHSRDLANIARLLGALEILEAHYRTLGAGKKRPERTHLQSSGHQLLMTRAGPLDLLGTIGHGYGYDELIGSTIELEIGKGLHVRVLKLETLIKVKEETAGEKDKLALLILRRTLKERTTR